MTDQNQNQVADTASSSPAGESLEEQNVFDLLGVNDGSNEDKEKFLDELQQVIWEDFIENDVELLVTTEEMVKVKQIIDKENQDDLEKQEELIGYLEKIIPDLEEIMLEKALELKEEMVQERINGMKAFHAGQPESLTKLTEAEKLFSEEKWHSGAVILNTIA